MYQTLKKKKKKKKDKKTISSSIPWRAKSAGNDYP